MNARSVATEAEFHANGLIPVLKNEFDTFNASQNRRRHIDEFETDFGITIRK